nr:hypothetical protein [Tanacetum cinerariifolium]
DMDMNEGIELVKDTEEDDSEVQEVVEVVTTAKLITEVVTATALQVSAASTTIPAAKPTIPAAKPTIPAAKPTIPAAASTVVAAYTRRRKGVTIRYPEEELSLKTLAKTPKTMFEELDGQDAIWRNQKSVNGLALVKRWKLLT